MELTDLLLAILLIPMVIVMVYLVVYGLALNQWFFTIVKEGQAVSILKGGSLSHFIMSYRGHYLNDPRAGLGRTPFDPNVPPWELMDHSNPDAFVSAYRPWSIWRLFERVGIYYFGLTPLYEVDYYPFAWVEEKQGPNGVKVAWPRQARTGIIVVAAFTYRFKLAAAENVERTPLDLDYSLTIIARNLNKMRFTNVNWLNRLETETNGHARRWVAKRTYDQALAERGVSASTEGAVASDTDATTTTPVSHDNFASMLLGLNERLETERTPITLRDRLGVEIQAASLQEVTIVGSDAPAIAKATTAQTVARMNAEARRAEAQGEGDAIRTLAAAEKERIDLTYGAVESHPSGVELYRLDAVRAAAQSPGATIVHAGSMVDGVAAQVLKAAQPAPPPTNSQ